MSDRVLDDDQFTGESDEGIYPVHVHAQRAGRDRLDHFFSARGRFDRCDVPEGPLNHRYQWDDHQIGLRRRCRSVDVSGDIGPAQIEQGVAGGAARRRDPPGKPLKFRLPQDGKLRLQQSHCLR